MPAAVLLGVKRPGREAGHSDSTVTENKHFCSCETACDSYRYCI